MSVRARHALCRGKKGGGNVLTENVLCSRVGEAGGAVAVAAEELVEAKGVLALVQALHVEGDVVAARERSNKRLEERVGRR